MSLMRTCFSTYVTLFLLIACNEAAVGQNKVDSLKSLLKTELADTSRANVLYQLSKSLFRRNPDTAMLLAKQSWEIAEEIGHQKGIANAMTVFAIRYLHTSQNDSASKYLKKVLNIYRELNDAKSEAAILNNLGVLYNSKRDFGQSLFYYQQALDLRLKSQDSIQAITAILNIGGLHREQKHYDLALKYFDIVVRLSKLKNDFALMADAFYHIGTLYQTKNEYTPAMGYLKRSIHLLDSIGQTCRALAPRVNLYSVLMDLEQLDEALAYIELCTPIAKSCQSIEVITFVNLEKGVIFKRQGSVKKAENHLMEAYQMAKKYELPEQIQTTSWYLYELYKEQGRDSKALIYLEESSEAKEALFNAELTRELTTLELNFEFQHERDSIEAQKQRELLVLNSEVEKQQTSKRFYLSGLLVALGFLVIFYRNFRLKKRSNDLLRSKNKVQAEKLQLEESTREQLEVENENKNRSLMSTSMLLLNLNERLNSVIDNINKYKQAIGEPGLTKITGQLEDMKNAEDSWERIKVHFENVHPGFFEQLEDKYPDLSSNEYRLLAFIKMKLSDKEIALMSNVTKGAVSQSKRRLKRKIGLPHYEKNILEHIFETDYHQHSN